MGPSVTSPKLSRRMFTRLYVPFALAVICMPFVDATLGAESDGVNETIEFARQRLEDPDEWIRSAALDVVATSNPQLARARLEKALDDPSVEVRARAVSHFKHLPLKNTSAKIQTLLDESSKHVDATLRVDPEIVDSWSLLEWETTEALLAQGSDEERRFARDHIRRVLSDKRNSNRWDVMAELVGKYQLRDLAPLLKQPGPALSVPAIRLGSLVKLGDAGSVNELRSALSDEYSLSYILRDESLVKSLGLTKRDIAPHLNTHRRSGKEAAAIALARMGDFEGVQSLMKQFLDGKLGLEGGAALMAAGEAGDRRFLSELVTYFHSINGNEVNDVAKKLSAAITIAEIAARHPETAK